VFSAAHPTARRDNRTQPRVSTPGIECEDEFEYDWGTIGGQGETSQRASDFLCIESQTNAFVLESYSNSPSSSIPWIERLKPISARLCEAHYLSAHGVETLGLSWVNPGLNPVAHWGLDAPAFLTVRRDWRIASVGPCLAEEAESCESIASFL